MYGFNWKEVLGMAFAPLFLWVMLVVAVIQDNKDKEKQSACVKQCSFNKEITNKQ